MDDELFREWLYGKKETWHTAGLPAPPRIEKEEEWWVFDPSENTVPVVSISRHRIGVDGKGVNTLVSLYGCDLNCQYCINPQCKGSEEGAIRHSPSSLYEVVKKDDAYFQETEGGITFSGGEPLKYSDFICAFSSYVDKKWKVRVETSLYWDTEVFYRLYNVVDEWIIDIKTLDPEIYHAYTGGDFNKMKQFLDLMSEYSFIRKRCLIRIPIIPGFTTEEDARNTQRLLSDMGFTRFEIFTYTTPDEEKTEKESNPEEHTSEGSNPEDSHHALSSKATQCGKMRCGFFKTLRNIIAKRLGIKLSETQCDYKGPCHGTCPECDAELQLLNEGLKKSREIDSQRHENS